MELPGYPDFGPTTQEGEMKTNIFITAVVALISGVIGAMGYTYYVGPKPGEPPSSRSVAETGRNQEPNSKSQSGGGSTQQSTEASASSVAPAISAAQEVAELKQQIKNLNQRLARLGEEVDRLQTQLSLAVPLLQRIAPKN